MNNFGAMPRGEAVRSLVAGTTRAGALGGAVVSLGTGGLLAFYKGGVLDGPAWNLLLAGYALAVGLLAGALVGLVAGLLFAWVPAAWPGAAAARRALGALAVLLAAAGVSRGLVSGASFPALPGWAIGVLVALALASILAWLRAGAAARSRAARLLPGLALLAALAVAGVPLLVPGHPRQIADGPAGAAAAAPAAVASPAPASPAAAVPPARNVLLIVIDTLRPDHLSCYGYARATSPRIDRFAEEGVRFERALAQKGRTSPSVATILSGTYPHTHGLLDIRSVLPDGVLTLPEIVGPRGWRTGGIITNANLSRIFNFQQGFETWEELGNGDLHATADTVTDRAIPWLEQHRDQPFLLYLHYVDPHTPYTPPAAYKDRFVGDALYGQYRHLRPPLGSSAKGAIDPHAVIENGSRDVDLYVARYDAEIAFNDAEVGRLLDALDGMGLRDDTLVILTADHGESLAGHQIYFAHGLAPYDDSLRVPLIVRYPRAIGAPAVVKTAVETTDIAPTVIAALGLPRSPTFEGQDLWPLMLNPGAEPSRHVFAEEGARLKLLSRVVSTERYKLIFNPGGVDLPKSAFRPTALLTRGGVRSLWWAAHDGPGAHERWELYDVADDPDETENLFRARPALVEPLRRALARWEASAPPDRSPTRLALEDISVEQLKQLEALGYVK